VTELIPEQYRKDEEIIRLTIEQIKKDFGTQLPELTFSGDKSLLFDELSKQISDALKATRKTNLTAFQSLLYRVDIKESVVAETSAAKDSFFALAEKIIQREFQKVLTRKFFSR
jgi:hypothetical protein